MTERRNRTALDVGLVAGGAKETCGGVCTDMHSGIFYLKKYTFRHLQCTLLPGNIGTVGAKSMARLRQN
jgi:hypothetical protein